MTGDIKRFSKCFFIILSVAICLSVAWQIIIIIYLQRKGIVVESPIRWYVWIVLIFGSAWILYFAVIIFEPNKGMRVALTILGITATLCYLNGWLLLTLPFLWISSIIAILLLVLAWRFYQVAKLVDSSPGNVKRTVFTILADEARYREYAKKCSKILGWKKWRTVILLSSENVDKRLSSLKIPDEVKKEVMNETTKGLFVLISEAPFKAGNWIGKKYFVID
jgi:hypothetical protein